MIHPVFVLAGTSAVAITLGITFAAGWAVVAGLVLMLLADIVLVNWSPPK